ncbi:MAG: hypothetical protein EBR46_09910, partial [Betaproteobacteria bacterium]|nr:hypothetical protein [Betaproteobacteria bacterium]
MHRAFEYPRFEYRRPPEMGAPDAGRHPHPLIIVGAGGHARETAYAFLLSAPADRFIGFLDDRATGSTPEGWPILGSIDSARSHLSARFLVAINDPRTRRTV